MQTLKRGTQLMKRFRLRGIDLEKNVDTIEFLFKARRAEQAPNLIYKKYPSLDTTYDAETGICTVFFAEEDTRKLRAYEKIYMDTKIVYDDGIIPEVIMKVFDITETLFKGGNNG